MGAIKKATRPNEVICFIPIELNTVKDGKGYMFVIMDAYSEFIFSAEIERGCEMEYVLKQVQQLLNNKDFSRDRGHAFTLVMSDFDQYRKEIEKLIQPHGGTMIVDGAYIKKELAPAIEHFLTILKNHK